MITCRRPCVRQCWSRLNIVKPGEQVRRERIQIEAGVLLYQAVE